MRQGAREGPLRGLPCSGCVCSTCSRAGLQTVPAALGAAGNGPAALQGHPPSSQPLLSSPQGPTAVGWTLPRAGEAPASRRVGHSWAGGSHGSPQGPRGQPAGGEGRTGGQGGPCWEPEQPGVPKPGGGGIPRPRMPPHCSAFALGCHPLCGEGGPQTRGLLCAAPPGAPGPARGWPCTPSAPPGLQPSSAGLPPSSLLKAPARSWTLTQSCQPSPEGLPAPTPPCRPRPSAPGTSSLRGCDCGRQCGDAAPVTPATRAPPVPLRQSRRDFPQEFCPYAASASGQAVPLGGLSLPQLQAGSVGGATDPGARRVVATASRGEGAATLST